MKSVKVVSFFLTFTIVLSVGITAFAELIDISTHWANKEISYFVEKGILNGYPDGTFKPENYVTKAEIYKIINKVMGYTEVAEVNFLDVKESDWFYQDVAKGLKAGYILEKPGGNLIPRAPITREALASIIEIAYGLSRDESNSAKVFLDENEIAPDELITRAEVAKIINNISRNPITKEEETKIVIEKVKEKEERYKKEKPIENSGSSSNSIIHEPDPIPQIVPVIEAPIEVENITVSSDEIVLMLGGSTWKLTTYVYPENATDKSITWSTSDPNVVNVVDGVLTPIGIGVATITAQAGDKIATTKVAVECLVTSIAVEVVDGKDTITKLGGQLQMIATVIPMDAINREVTWSIVNGASAATINSSGLLSALANGIVTIRAKAKDGSEIIGEREIMISGQLKESVDVLVVKLNSNSLDLSVDGSPKLLDAIVYPENASNKKVKWSSSNEKVATVAAGIVTPIAAGTATITVTTEDGGKIDSCEVTVTLLTAKITFFINDNSGKPIVDALIKIDNNTLVTDESGLARITLKRASYPYSVSKAGYITEEKNLPVRENKVVNIILRKEEPRISP